MTEQAWARNRASTNNGRPAAVTPKEAKTDVITNNPESPALGQAGITTDAPAAALTLSRQHAEDRTAPMVVMDRGMSAAVPPSVLQKRIWLSALEALNRLRVLRAVDVAVACFPERPFKAALSAAQRAMRGMAKAKLVRRYRTERFQHVYALTVAGARWLEEYGIEGVSSVRRVSEMSNPEHMLWMNFIVLAAQARGLSAFTESEVLKGLNRDAENGEQVKQGLTIVGVPRGTRTLRPDALIQEANGVTWVEIDRSKRGSDREAALSALVGRMGTKLANGDVLRRVVVFARSKRILLRARAVLKAKAQASNYQVLTYDGPGLHIRQTEPDMYEIWKAVLPPGKQFDEDACVGHVVLQLLPTWLPNVRIDAAHRLPPAGWLNDNYLPYRRPASSAPWPSAASPLLGRTAYP